MMRSFEYGRDGSILSSCSDVFADSNITTATLEREFRSGRPELVLSTNCRRPEIECGGLPMPPICKSLFCLLATYLLLSGFNTSFSSAQQNSSSVRSTVALEAGKSTYTTSCAGCHGLDGRGSDKAANISGSAKVQHLSDGQLASIISNGIPGTGMPGFHTLSAPQVRAIVSYVRSLQGKVESRK